MKTTVYVLAWKNDHGLNVKASRNRKELMDFLYSYVCEWWGDVAGQDVDGKQVVPNKPPVNKNRAIALYFDNHPSFEQYTLETQEV
jgi:hypothetical protein